MGLLFAVAVSEGLLRGTGLRLPAWFRVPYYLVLALFFLYPLAISRFVDDPHGEAMMWGLFGFSSAAGLVFLTLLPAIRRGPDYVRRQRQPLALAALPVGAVRPARLRRRWPGPFCCAGRCTCSAPPTTRG